MCKWGVEINSFGRNPQLFVAWHTVEGTHVVQAIGQFDQDNTHIFTECEQHFAEILSLRRSSVFKYPADFRETINDLGNFFSKGPLNVGQLDVRVFHYILNQGAT